VDQQEPACSDVKPAVYDAAYVERSMGRGTIADPFDAQQPQLGINIDGNHPLSPQRAQFGLQEQDNLLLAGDYRTACDGSVKANRIRSREALIAFATRIPTPARSRHQDADMIAPTEPKSRMSAPAVRIGWLTPISSRKWASFCCGLG